MIIFNFSQRELSAEVQKYHVRTVLPFCFDAEETHSSTAIYVDRKYYYMNGQDNEGVMIASVENHTNQLFNCNTGVESPVNIILFQKEKDNQTQNVSSSGIKNTFFHIDPFTPGLAISIYSLKDIDLYYIFYKEIPSPPPNCG